MGTGEILHFVQNDKIINGFSVFSAVKIRITTDENQPKAQVVRTKNCNFNFFFIPS